MLREFRKKYDENEDRWDRRIEDRARKQEIRFWKRMAMPEVPETEEGYWSDDDDLVDPVEKERLKEVERKVAEQVLASTSSTSSHQSDDSDGESSMSLGMGGVAMERDNGSAAPTPPPRPASTGSTGGQTG
jgi:hypothetical protein